ncbi:MAG: ABC transporter ATP-binding protein [Kofleriaceae bacterium]
MRALTINHLTVAYGRRVAVDDLSLEIEAGAVVALLGPNGAGKSTALLAIAGGLQPSRGDIAIGGIDLARDPLGAKQRLGLADQPPSLYEYFTVAEHVAMVADVRGGGDRAGERALLDQLGLAAVADRPCRELSFGMRQRVGLAAALVAEPRLILLDETLNGLDPHAGRRARAALAAASARGAAIVMSTHLLDVAARMATRVLIMDQGKLVVDLAGPALADQLATGPDALEALYVATVADRGVA